MVWKGGLEPELGVRRVARVFKVKTAPRVRQEGNPGKGGEVQTYSQGSGTTLGRSLSKLKISISICG